MSSRAIVIAIALIIVGFTLMSLRDYFVQEPVVEVQAPVVQRILVAKRNLPSGSFIKTMEDLDWQAVPENANKPESGDKVEGAINEYQYEGSVNIDEFNGAVVRRSIRAGEPLIPSMVMKSGEGGFLSAVLEPGKRAVSISVNPISGNAGFVSPGDKVDLLITYHIKLGSGADPESIVTETFIRNVRVLAVDQSLDNPENKAILAKTITVEVVPAEAEKISVAAEIGKISVALVSTGVVDVGKGGNQSQSNNYTLGSDVGNLIAKKDIATNKVRVIRAEKVETLEFYQDTK